MAMALESRTAAANKPSDCDASGAEYEQGHHKQEREPSKRFQCSASRYQTRSWRYVGECICTGFTHDLSPVMRCVCPPALRREENPGKRKRAKCIFSP